MPPPEDKMVLRTAFRHNNEQSAGQSFFFFTQRVTMDTAVGMSMIEIRRGTIALWIGILAGPIAWASALQVRYSIVVYVCRNHAFWLMWLVTLGALLVAAFGGFCAWRGWTDSTPRVRFMALGGLSISALFALAIISAAIPDLSSRACP
jgi:hypothetical protein